MGVGPLAGVKILDMTHVMAGPVCTLLLADLGADVIKVERPPEGDDSRHMAPPYVGEESAAYLMMNRHKRGVVLNLKQQDGREVFRRLAARADVLVENYRPGVLDRLGLGEGVLRADNPGLIWCAISGYGRSGPYANRPGYDLMAQAMSGIMSFTGEGAGRPPVKVGAPLSDISAGILAALGVVSALVERGHTGIGRTVESSLFEASIMYTFWQSAITLATGESPQPLGSAHPLDGPYQAFEAADGWFVVGAANQANWLRLIDLLGRPDLNDDPRFSTNPQRVANLAPLIDILAPLFMQRGVADWIERMEGAGIPAAPVLNVGQMLANPQTIARGMVSEVEHSALGRVRTLGCPIRFDGEPADLGRGAPLFGEHTSSVMREYGYDDGEIAARVASGAVFCADRLVTPA